MKFPWAASARAIANARDEGFSKLTFDHDTHRIASWAAASSAPGPAT